VTTGESRRGRRIVGRIGRGEVLPQALVAVCRERGVRSGEIRATGSLETVDVAAFDQVRKVWKATRAFTGGFDVIGFYGTVSERSGDLALWARVIVMRERDNGIEVLGGHLVSARIYAFEYVIEAFDDLLLRRTNDAATGLALWGEAIPLGAEPAPPAATPTEPRVVTWSEVAHSAPPREPEPEEAEAGDLGEGDILLHPTFGRCEVQRIEGGNEFAHVRLKNGRLVRLSLDVVRVSPGGREGDKRVFNVRVVG
jgi:predicted DNA-binding protein with PD1-like motif